MQKANCEDFDREVRRVLYLNLELGDQLKKKIFTSLSSTYNPSTGYNTLNVILA